jgi:hypothetical protein
VAIRPSISSSLRAVAASELKAAEIDRSEKALTGVLATWVVFQPWAFGTMHVWAQLIAISLAACALIIALRPRIMVVASSAEGTVRSQPLRHLLHLPLFWMTLALFGYVIVQTLNPAWVYRSSGTHWWMERQPHLEWLPSGYTAPFAKMNGWRKLMIWASPFLVGCAAWIGITRRRTASFLLHALLVNGTAIALFGIAQKFIGGRKIYGAFEFPGTDSFASFVYRNHAAAFLIIVATVGLGLAIRAYLSGERRFQRSTPAPLIALLACVCTAAILYSGSRAGSAFALAGLCAIAFAGWRLVVDSAASRWAPLFFAAFVLVVAAAWITSAGTGDVGMRTRRLLTGSDVTLRDRVYIAEGTNEALRENLWFGFGSGGFRHLSPRYLHGFPILSQEVALGQAQVYSIRHLSTNESHSDLLQLVAELGLIGSGLVFSIGATALAALSLRHRRTHGVAAGALIGLLTLVGYAGIDFPLHNPAVVAALTLAVVVSARLSDLENAPPGRTSGPTS